MSKRGTVERSAHAADRRRRATPVERPPSLSEHVCQVLRNDILSGRLEPGDRLTETALMERMGVSRTPVREGLRRLEGEGLVISHRGRGTYITYRLDADEAALIYECRVIFEPYLTRLAASRISSEELALLDDIQERFAAIGDMEHHRAGQLDADFHLTIYEASRSQLMSVVRGYWSRLQLDLSERAYTEEVPQCFADEHQAIFTALADGDGDRAAHAMRRHIEHGRAVVQKALNDRTGLGRLGMEATS